MTTTGPLHVAVAVVGDYLPHAAAMVASIVANVEEPDLHLHLLHDGQLPPEGLAAFADMATGFGVRLRTHRVEDGRLDGIPTAGFTTKASWYRVFLPELLPEVDRLLYLDADLLVLDSLRPLRDVELGPGYLAAVTNVFEPVHVHRPAQLGLRGPDAYFNAGVLLVDLDRMRTDGMADAVLDYARANAPRLLWRDQDALNVVMGEGRVALHPRWNCMNSVMEFEEASRVFGPEAVEDARRHPAIRHFEGPSINKPWHRLADPASQRLYRAYRRDTPWPRVAYEDVTPATLALRLLPARWRRPLYVRLLQARGRLGLRAGDRRR